MEDLKKKRRIKDFFTFEDGVLTLRDPDIHTKRSFKMRIDEVTQDFAGGLLDEFDRQGFDPADVKEIVVDNIQISSSDDFYLGLDLFENVETITFNPDVKRVNKGYFYVPDFGVYEDGFMKDAYKNLKTVRFNGTFANKEVFGFLNKYGCRLPQTLVFNNVDDESIERVCQANPQCKVKLENCGYGITSGGNKDGQEAKDVFEQLSARRGACRVETDKIKEELRKKQEEDEEKFRIAREEQERLRDEERRRQEEEDFRREKLRQQALHAGVNESCAFDSQTKELKILGSKGFALGIILDYLKLKPDDVKSLRISCPNEIDIPTWDSYSGFPMTTNYYRNHYQLPILELDQIVFENGARINNSTFGRGTFRVQDCFTAKYYDMFKYTAKSIIIEPGVVFGPSYYKGATGKYTDERIFKYASGEIIRNDLETKKKNIVSSIQEEFGIDEPQEQIKEVRQKLNNSQNLATDVIRLARKNEEEKVIPQP